MTDTTPMRDRMARALCSDFDTLPDAATYMHRKSNPDKHWLDKGEVLADVDALLAVLEAPSEAMCQAGVENAIVGFGAIKSQDMGDAAACFTAMVKAIRGGA